MTPLPKSTPSQLSKRKRLGSSLKNGKQKSITSFFSSTPRSTGIRSPSFSTTQTDQSPSSARGSAVNASGSWTSSAVRSTQGQIPEHCLSPVDSATKPEDLRRTLFVDDADEEPPILRKRRRVLGESDDSDTDEEMMDKPLVSEPLVTPSRPVRNASIAPSRKRATPKDPKAFFKSSQTSSQEDTLALTDTVKSAHGSILTSLRRSDIPAVDSNSPDSELIKSNMQSRMNKAREQLMELSGSVKVGQEPNGWCENHSWSVDIRDAQMRRPSHPDYDKSTLYIPPSELSDARGAKNLTPFQKQFWRIKMANYDVIIFFKKGKFYELYDVDADVGSSILGLNFTKGGRVDMRCCGVPEQAFDKHCSRLIDLGYKVGRVEQTETANAAEKRKQSATNTSAVCERSLVRILTKGTVREEGLLRDHRARHIVSITRDKSSRIGSSDSRTTIADDDSSAVTIGFCFTDVASGSINISQFTDNSRLLRTERLITFLAPYELITDSTRSCDRLSEIVKWTSRKFKSDVNDLGLKEGFRPVTSSKLSSYLLHSVQSTECQATMQRLSKYMERYEIGSLAFGGLISHLKSLIIDKETLSLANYTLCPDPDAEDQGNHSKQCEGPVLTASSSSRLYMDASALQNLEVLHSIMGTEHGSLLSFVDRAHTPAGRRLIRKWLAEPLASSADIEDRLDAIEDIHGIEDSDGGNLLQRILKLMKSKDLERALPKLHQFATVSDGAVMFDDTNKRRVKEFVQVLRGVQNCLSALESLAEGLEQTSSKSTRLKWLCSLGGGVPNDALDKLTFFMGEAFDLHLAESEGEIVPKEGAMPSYDEARNGLLSVDASLEDELNQWKKKLKDNSIKYYHRGKEPYQLEIKKETIQKKTPDEFDVVSESKTTMRFYTTKIKKLIRERVGREEAFERESGCVARNLASQFDKDYAAWAAVARACAEIDALVGIAEASRAADNGPMVRPQILSNDHSLAIFKAKALRHPILAQSGMFVANDVSLGENGETDVMILTGPNAGGKSTMARQVGLAVILAQIGCFVPAESLVLRPFRDIFVRMGASDELARGRSTFMVEMEEVSHMLNNASSHSLVIADEVGRGTSTHDGYAIAHAVVDHILRTNKSLTIFSTHYSQLANDIAKRNEVDAEHLRCDVYEMAAVVDENKKSITFLYKLNKGASSHSRGIYCARVAGVDAVIADAAEKAALDLDNSMNQRASINRVTRLIESLNVNEENAVKGLLRSS